MQFPSGYMPQTARQHAANDYQKWRAGVLAVRELPEYKLRKLYQLGYTAADVRADRHWEIFPLGGERERRKQAVAAARQRGRKLGRAIGEKAIQHLYAVALRDAAARILELHRLTPEQLARLRGDLERFKELVKQYGPQDYAKRKRT